MTNQSIGQVKFFATPSGELFAKSLVKSYNQKLSSDVSKTNHVLGDLEMRVFADTESVPKANETVRGCDVYLVAQCFNPNMENTVPHNTQELLQSAYTLKSAGAKNITLVLPLHPYARQDKAHGREAIIMKYFADQVTLAGVDNVLTADLHAEQTVGFYSPQETKLDNLRASKVILPKLKEIYSGGLENLVVMAPDTGGAPRAEYYRDKLGVGVDMAQCIKKRDKNSSNSVSKLEILGDVSGRDVLIVDDMIDTGGSVIKLVDQLNVAGAKEITVACTHPLLNNGADEKLSGVGIKLITTDTIPRTQIFLDKHSSWYTQVSIAPNFAEAINGLNTSSSLWSQCKEE